MLIQRPFTIGPCTKLEDSNSNEKMNEKSFGSENIGYFNELCGYIVDINNYSVIGFHFYIS